MKLQETNSQSINALPKLTGSPSQLNCPSAQLGAALECSPKASQTDWHSSWFFSGQPSNCQNNIPNWTTTTFFLWGTWWRSWLRHCATNRKVAGSIPDGGIFHWHNPSGRTVAQRSTQPLTEISATNMPWGGKGGRCVGLTTLPSSCADCLEIWEPQPPGTLRACFTFYRIFPYPFKFIIIHLTTRRFIVGVQQHVQKKCSSETSVRTKDYRCSNLEGHNVN
jgi:hypothetical protein